MKFEATERGFLLNGKKFYLLSGEVHYFRIPRHLWKAHLDKLKEAQFKCVSTYIPWDWHEIREGEFDFAGRTHPQRDLLRFLKLVRDSGLFLIVKPGPFILAEYARHGLPEWLLRDYSEVLTRRSDGQPTLIGQATLLSDTFLGKVFAWYDRVMPVIARNQASRGGPIIMMQVCNEVGVLSWLANEPDYNAAPLGYYKEYLKKEYAKIDKLNAVYNTSYADFEEVVPPAGRFIDSKEDYAIDLDWHFFWSWYWGVYIEKLVERIRGYKIKVRLFHNLPGWVYGRASEFAMNVSGYGDIAALYPDVIMAADHIPENVSYRNFYDEQICNQVSLAIQKSKGPLYIAEMQSGTREHNVVVYPHELELFYLGNLFHGSSGMNLYMFSQGKNPKARGVFGPVFYWQTPLNWEGKESEFYGVARRLGRFVDKYADKILSAERRPRICVLYYRPYFANWLARKTDFSRCGLDYDPEYIREKVWHDGLLKALSLFSYDFDIKDLQLVKPGELLSYEQVWSLSLDYMDGRSQEKLSEFVKAGGNLVIMPCLPRFDLRLRQNDSLRRSLDIGEKAAEHHTPPKADVFGVKDISVLSPIKTYEAKNARIFSRTPGGSPCGIVKKYKKGKLTLLGTAFTHGIQEHLAAYLRFFQSDKVRPWAQSDCPDIYLQQIFGKGYAFLFAANYHMVKKEGKISFTHPQGRRTVNFPGKITLEPSSCKVFYVEGSSISQIYPEAK